MEPRVVWKGIELLREPARSLRRAHEQGRMVRILPGWFLERERWQPLHEWERLSLLAAAIAQVSRRRVPCGNTSLALRGLPSWGRPRLLSFQVAKGFHRKVAHRVTAGGDVPVTWVCTLHDQPGFAPVDVGAGVPTTSALESVAHVAAGMDFEAAVVAIDGFRHAYRGSATGEGAEPRAARSHGTEPTKAQLRPHGSPIETSLHERLAVLGAAAARSRALAAWEQSTDLAESVGETLSRLAMVRLGFQRPVLQRVVQVAGAEYRPDFSWPEHMVLGEFDGAAKYAGRTESEVRRREREREEWLKRAGYRVFRWNWHEMRDPHQFRAILTANGVPTTATR